MEPFDDPAGSGEFAIGFGDDPAAEEMIGATMVVDDMLDQLRDQTGLAVDAITRPIDDMITECSAVTGEVVGCLYGAIDRRIEAVNNIVFSLQDRIDRGIDQRMELVAAYVGNVLDELPPPPGLSLVVAPTTPTIDQCRLTPSLPGCYPGTGPTVPTQPVVDTPTITTGGKCDGSPGSYTYGKTLPVGQPGPAGWSIMSWFTADCETVFDPGNAKWANWGPPGDPGCGIVFNKPADCGGGTIPGNDTTTTGPGNDTGCIRLCQPLCGPSQPPTGPGNDTTGGGDWTDDAGGDDPLGVCEVPDDDESITINDPALPTDDDGTPIDYGATGDDVGLGVGGRFNQRSPARCAPPPPPGKVDFLFIAECGPENWSAAAEGFANLNLAEGGTAQAMSTSITAQINQSAEALSTSGWLTSALKWSFTYTIGAIVGAIGTAVALFLSIIPIPKSCQNIVTSGLLTYQGLIRFAQRWLGIVPPNIMAAMDQAINYSCQVYVPTMAELTAQRLAGVLTKDEWEYGAKLNGSCINWFQRSYDGGLAVPTIPQAYSLYRAGLIDETRWREILKRNRVPLDADTFEWSKLTEAIPGPGDLLKFMTRDVADQDAVDANQLDTDFDKKWTGDIKDWGDRQGLTDKIAKAHWRAHWFYPSPQQLLTMYHRLRPGTEAATYDGKDVSFTLEQLRETLKINDLAPSFIDRLAATSNPAIAISYLRILYQTGVINEDNMVPRFQDLGFTLDNARVMAKGFARSMTQQRARYLGNYEPQIARQDFIKFGINEEKYRLALLDAGHTGDDVENAVASAKVEQKSKINIRLQRQARLAYFKGRLSDGQYQSFLRNLGLEQDIVEAIFLRDSAERQWKYKELAIAKMCHLVKQGYLPVSEYVERAQNLGYKAADAALLAASCVQDIQEAQAKRIAAEIKEAIREGARLDKQAKSKEKALCKAERAAQRCAANPTEACAIDTAPPPCDLIGV